MTVITRGDRELALTCDTFPQRAHQKIQRRITDLIERLDARIQAAAPYRTGRLQSEITPKVYGDQAERVAGYVSVYAPGVPNEYAKAATLEYGSNKARRIFQRSTGLLARLHGGRRRIVERMSAPARIQAFAYLRNPLEQMRPEVEAELNAALSETVDEANA